MSNTVKIQWLDLENLDPLLKKKYRTLTTKEFECCLEGKDPFEISEGKVIAFSAIDNENPVGLLLAVSYPVFDTAEIYSFYVSEELRNKGIGTRLLTSFLDYVPSVGAKYAMMKYSTSKPYSPCVERILRQTEWDSPTLFMMKYFYDCYQFHPDWFTNPFEMPEGFSLFFWKDLTPQDRSRVQYLIEQRAILSSVNPFLREELVEPINSLGIRYQNEVVGWMVNHRVDENTICYAKLFILKEHQTTGSAILMLRRSIELQQESPVQYSVFNVNQKQVHARWLKFVETKLKPYAQSVETINMVVRKLT